jgi:CSLREA domain-containing protein
MLMLLSAVPAAHAATLTVTTTADNTTDDTDCTLREAILAANGAAANADCGAGSAGLDTIAFNIPAGQCGADGVCIITLSGSNLPTITEALTIDGTTQPRYGTAPANVCATASAPSYMRIMVRGGSLNINHASGSSTIRGLSLVDPDLDPSGAPAGVHAKAGSGHHIECNHLGVNGPGTAGVGVTYNGVVIESTASGVIVGTDGDGSNDLAERNVFGALEVTGVYINSNSDNVIAGNIFGFGADGMTALSINGDAVFIRQFSNSNRVGTNGDGVSDTLERNIIGNVVDGVDVCTYGPTPTVIAGNWIGLDAAGAAAPCARGVHVNEEAGAGQPQGTAITANTIGHCTFGIYLEGDDVDDTNITANFIGVMPDGTPIASGMQIGIRIDEGADGTLIGDGTLAGANTIGNASNSGIFIVGNDSVTGTVIDTNFIGVGPGGTDAGNNEAGIWFSAIQDGDTGSVVRGNTIGYNTTGIAIVSDEASPAQIEITGNYIGTDSAAAFANYANGTGLLINNSTTGANAHLLRNNLFAHSDGQAVYLADDTSFAAGSDDNCFIGNATGFQYNGTTVDLPFENNWWNAADGPSGVGPGSGDSIQYGSTGTLDFTPWLTSNEGTICDPLLENGSMEADANGDKVPDFWKIKSPSGKSKQKCDNPAKGKYYAHTGTCAVVLASTGAKEVLQQTYTPSGGGLAGDQYRLSLWASGKGIPASATARAVVQFAYTDGTKEKLILNLPTGDYAYQQLLLDVTAAKDYTSIKVKIEYAASGGKLSIDDVSLVQTN